MKKKNRILTESQKRQIIQDKEKSILKSFASTFNKIKRIDENEIPQTPLIVHSLYIDANGYFQTELTIMGVDSYIEGILLDFKTSYSPYEPQTYDYPGSPGGIDGITAGEVQLQRFIFGDDFDSENQEDIIEKLSSVAPDMVKMVKDAIEGDIDTKVRDGYFNTDEFLPSDPRDDMREDKDLNEAGRTSMSEFFGTETTDNVDTLLKMFSKYKPTSGWFMNVGYINNVSKSTIPVNINPENLDEFEGIAAKLDNPKLKRYLDSMINDPEWTRVKDKYSVDQDRAARGLKTKSSGKATYTNPYAARTYKDKETKEKVTIPAKVYSTKNYTIQWDNLNQKSDRDSEVKKAYDKYGLDWEEGSIPTDDWRGRGWEGVPGVPFSQHKDTGTKRLAIYGKKTALKPHSSKFFINLGGDIAQLTSEETNFIFANSTYSSERPMKKSLRDMENQEAAREIYNLENLYDYKNLNLEKIIYITCSMNIDGENKKFSYINRNAVPDGLKPGEFGELIQDSLPKSIS